MRHKSALVILLLLAALFVAGCVSGAPYNPPANAVMGRQIYDLGNVTSWKYAVVMSAGGANATWNMSVNDVRDPDGEMNMTVYTLGNGMDVVYNIWWNSTTYNVDRMHAKGKIGDLYQDKDTSTQQIFTLPETGLMYYNVPLQYAGAVNVRDTNGQIGQLGVFTATDNKGFTLTYWAHPAIPLPVKILMSSRDYNITMMLLDYK